VTPEISTRLDANPDSAAVARRFVREVLDAWDCDDADEVALLLTSEVVSNAVRHAATDLAVRLQLDEDAATLRIEVTDADATMPEVREQSPDATGGRGLVLVEALAQRWGADRTPSGKVVWFELGARPLPRAD
jgi:anti-sigma regulatory factor (Ser/Thr protein kinase)